MENNANMLTSIRTLGKLYAQNLEKVRIAYALTQIEISIISFLYNNPGKDTAGDIVNLRMLPKGNVSLGVESLIQKSLLLRTPDKKDRRRIHLSLTKDALPIIKEVEQANLAFGKQIFKGFSKEETEQYSQMSERIVQNASNALQERK